MAANIDSLVLDLSTSANVRALFAALGFEPQTDVWYTADTLEWSGSAAAELRGRQFELLASLDADAFQVLLLEPSNAGVGLSKALQQRLFKTFDERLNQGLLVLPNQQRDEFEFVLLVDPRSKEQQQADAKLELLSWQFTPATMRPHQRRALELMEVAGLASFDVAERLQRAFKRAQQETLFRAQGFLSTYYLEQRIDSDAAVRDDWLALLHQMSALRKAAEAELAVEPLLQALGWSTLQLHGRDYLALNGQPIALFEQVAADQPLESVEASNQAEFKLIANLRREKESAGVLWGVLTNGAVWRLYSTLTSSISGAFYEVDLRDILMFGAEREMAYFGAFFSAAALAPATRPESLTQRIFVASQTLAKEIGENLKKIVFEQVFPKLASGIADDLQRRGEYVGDEAQLRLIYRATLIVLYRLLFLLYAESRRLLPTMHPAYYPHSLTRLLTEIAIRPAIEERHRKPLTPNADWAWSWLYDLWQAIDHGKAEWGVPRYNGGLFAGGDFGTSVSQHKAPYALLETITVGAMDLCAALDFLARDQSARNATEIQEMRRLIDYAALDVRRLGSIYEGLLEYQLVEVASGEHVRLALVNTRQERKSSGSYYTPDYIVEYIVEQAVGPVLAEHTQRFKDLLPQWAATRREYERYQRNAYEGAGTLQKRLAEQENEVVESLLDLKVLDPAMGSGHFLVEAVDFLTDGLIKVLENHRENPITQRLAGIRQDIRESMQEQGLAEVFLSDEQLSDTRLLRRLVMKRCVYGVDLNDMAVELAKLSLWLHSFTVGAPLSFLDHHLKWGNSLIGARVRDVQEQMEGTKNEYNEQAVQLDIFGTSSAFREMLTLAAQIEELVQIADANTRQVEQSTALYELYEQQVIPVKRLLDLWVTQHFGSREAAQLIRVYSGSKEKVNDIVAALMGQTALASSADQHAIEQARELFQQYRFFHWDLEFPEVFIDLANKAWKEPDAAGFDAVVGNPPYLNAWSMTDVDPVTRNVIEISSQHTELLHGHWDLYVAFLCKALVLTNKKGFHSFIIPDAFAREKYTTNLRKYVLENRTITNIMHFEGINVFDDVSRHCIVYVVGDSAVKQHTVIVMPSSNLRHKKIVGEIDQNAWLSLTGHQLRLGLASALIKHLIWKIDTISYKLGDFCYVMAGATTHSKDKVSFTKGSIITNEPVGNAKKFFDGKDLSRYEIIWKNRYLDYRYKEMYGPRVPGLFESKKIIVRNVTGSNETVIASYDDLGLYCDDLINCITYYENVEQYKVQTNYSGYKRINKPYPDLLYTTSVIASSLMTWYFRQIFATGTLQGSYSHTYPQQIRAFPIRRINFNTPEAERNQLVAQAKDFYQRDIERGTEATDWRGWREHWHGLWEWTAAQLPQIEDGQPNEAHERSDAVHDLLAFLAERMIELNKAKQTIAQRFTNWLDDETQSRSDDWTLKTVIQSYWEQPWTELERAFSKNAKNIIQTANLRSRERTAALEALGRVVRPQWEASVAELRPILAAIQATDRLIDLVVYRLYGLTDDEIDTIENAN